MAIIILPSSMTSTYDTLSELPTQRKVHIYQNTKQPLSAAQPLSACR